ncbi:MAG: methyltransferase domain-containing protein [Phycisphaeraceae bacterium]|nr:MAG: methyltransferase domain-containing protein [Phycisphaeraceae bacterium]
MSFGLGHGKPLDPAPGVVGVSDDELGPLPDDIVANPESGRVDPRAWFEEPGRPFELEIGSGKGTFLVQQAELEPGTNFLGIEWAGEFYAYAADRVRRRRPAGKLANVRLLHADAAEFLRWRCPDGVCRVIHLYFSDPWPKARHHKKRVIQHRFLAEAWRVLEPGGELRVVTDHDELWVWDMAHFEQWVGGGAVETATPSPRTEGVDRGEAARLHGTQMGTFIDADALARARASLPEMPDVVRVMRQHMPDPPFELLAFDRPESAGSGEIVGTNFERKFRVEGRSFHAGVLRKRAR